MTTHRQRKHVPYTPDQIFDLVADVERYPEFIPWCTRARITGREAIEGGRERMTAVLDVRFKMYRQSFVSEVTLDRAARLIDIEYVDGPFRHLDNRWRFEENPDGSCTIDFFIDFEFRSKALQLLISAVFTEAVRRMVGAFDARAHDLYSATRIG